MKAASIATLCLVAAARCYGTGGDSYEYPATLSDTLDILPGKSLGEIFLETSTIHPPAESWNSARLRALADRIGKEPVQQLLKAAELIINFGWLCAGASVLHTRERLMQSRSRRSRRGRCRG